MNDQASTWIFRGVVAAMFAIIMAMTGLIISNINTGMDGTNHRVDMLVYRANDMDRRLTTVETRLMDLQGKQ